MWCQCVANVLLMSLPTQSLLPRRPDLSLYLYLCMNRAMVVDEYNIYIYIYREREREREIGDACG